MTMQAHESDSIQATQKQLDEIASTVFSTPHYNKQSKERKISKEELATARLSAEIICVGHYMYYLHENLFVVRGRGKKDNIIFDSKDVWITTYKTTFYRSTWNRETSTLPSNMQAAVKTLIAICLTPWYKYTKALPMVKFTA